MHPKCRAMSQLTDRYIQYHMCTIRQVHTLSSVSIDILMNPATLWVSNLKLPRVQYHSTRDCSYSLFLLLTNKAVFRSSGAVV